MGTWGKSGWGRGGWGGPALGEELALVGAEAVRENVVRLHFNLPVFFSGGLEPADASSPDRYDVAVVEGTYGLDELPTRSVRPVLVELGLVEGAGGTLVDVAVDRPFSPWPARYRVTANQLVSLDGELLVPGFASLEFDGVQRGRVAPRLDAVVPRRDFANPQSLLALTTDGDVAIDGPLLLLQPTFPVDETGDYAIDQGLASYKKRVFRRCITRRGAFAHLPNYGVGLPDEIKTLGRPGVREALAAQAEEQIRLEPETRDVRVTVVRATSEPGLTYFRIRAQTKTGETISLDVPVSPTGR